MSRKHLIEKLQFAQLRTRLADQIAHFHPGSRKTLLNNLSELVAAITLAHNVQLAAIGAKLPVDTDEESREQWVRRQLSNDTKGTLELFRPLAQSLLAGFAGRSIRLILVPSGARAAGAVNEHNVHPSWTRWAATARLGTAPPCLGLK